MRKIWLALAAAASLLPSSEGFAETLVTGWISRSTTWTPSGNPYTIVGDVRVEGPNSPILTIAPGVVVRGYEGCRLSIGMYAPGGLMAVGTATNLITFTHYYWPESTGGPWNGIYFGPDALSTSRLIHARVIRPGWSDYWGASGIVIASSPTLQNVSVSNSSGTGVSIVGAGANPTLENVTVSSSAGVGIYVPAGNPLIRGATVTGNASSGLEVRQGATARLEGVSATGNGGAAFQIEPDVTLATATGLAATGNLIDGIEIVDRSPMSPEWNSSATWKKTNLPYVIPYAITVMGGAPVLTIEAGTTLRFGSIAYLSIGPWAAADPGTGGLQAVGTEALPITFTAHSASPAPGAWGGVFFRHGAQSASRLVYANFSFAGWAGNGAISISEASPTLEHVSQTGSAGQGVLVFGAGANPTLSSATVSHNADAGLYLSYGAKAAISGLSATSNAGPAVAQDASSLFTAISGLSVGGNGLDGIEIRTGNVQAPTTWWRTGFPYFVTGSAFVAGNDSSVLTIEPGVTVKFSSGQGLFVGHGAFGGLSAAGTEALPIALTSRAANPVPGSWRGVSFGDKALGSSALRWTRVEWAGSFGAAVAIDGASPTLEKVTVSGSSGKGISITGAASNAQLTGATISGNLGGGLSIDGGTPQVAGSTISGNTGYGIRVASGNPVVTSTWVNLTVAGASGSGDGVELLGGSASFSLYTTSNNARSGVRVSGGSGHRIQNGLIMGNASGLVSSIPASQVNARFNNWSSPLGPSGSGFGSGQSVSSGALFDPWLTGSPNASLYFQDQAISGPRFNPLFGTARWDLVSAVNGTWTLTVRDQSQNVVRTLVASGTAASMAWDGTNDSGVVQADGIYSYSLAIAKKYLVSTLATGRLYVDSSLRVELTSPVAGQTLSNVYSNGGRVFPIVGSASMADLSEWTLEYGNGTAPTAWTTLASGTTPISNGTLATWDTAGITNGPYSLRLTASDAFDSQFVSTIPVTVGHFDMASNKWEFNPRNGESVAYSSVVPFRVWVNLTIKNASGLSVRHFPIGYRDAGTYVDGWDGRAETSGIVPDGLYSFVAEVTDGPYSLTYDLSNEKVTLGGFQYFDDLADPSFTTLDPFNGRPLTFTYQPNAPGRSTVILSTRPRTGEGGGPIVGSCYPPPTVPPSPPPEFCLLDGNQWQSSQLQRVTWAGIDNAGRYRSDIRQVGVIIAHDDFPRNGIVVYGTPTRISNLTLSPRRIRPGVDTMQVDFDLVLPTGESRDVYVEFVNQESLSTLRTLTIPLRSTGHVTATWDGRAADGMMVAEGTYLVRAWTVDRSGNRASADHMTRLEY